MTSELQVKGSTIRSKLDFARDRLGPEAEAGLQRALQSMDDSLLLDSSWYPFATYDALLRKIADSHFGGDLEKLRNVGAYSAEKALERTYEAYTRKGDFAYFLQRISALHDRFYSAGRLVVTAHGEGFCELELVDSPVVSEADVQVAVGFYLGAAQRMGLTRARCGFTIEDGRVCYRLEWS